MKNNNDKSDNLIVILSFKSFNPIFSKFETNFVNTIGTKKSFVVNHFHLTPL